MTIALFAGATLANGQVKIDEGVLNHLKDLATNTEKNDTVCVERNIFNNEKINTETYVKDFQNGNIISISEEEYKSLMEKVSLKKDTIFIDSFYENINEKGDLPKFTPKGKSVATKKSVPNTKAELVKSDSTYFCLTFTEKSWNDLQKELGKSLIIPKKLLQSIRSVGIVTKDQNNNLSYHFSESDWQKIIKANNNIKIPSELVDKYSKHEIYTISNNTNKDIPTISTQKSH